MTRYAIELCGIQPTWQQRKLWTDMQKPGCRVSAASGHGTGKSFSYALFCDWALKVYPSSNTLLTANSIDQVRSVVWKELESMTTAINSKLPWMAPFFVRETRRYFARGYKDGWWVIPRTAPVSKPENIAGQHRKWYSALVDEASGLNDEILGIIRGALTDEENRMIMFSQPTRMVGFFADTHLGEISKLWNTHTLNSELSPRVSKKFIYEKLIEYGGHHSPEYQIKVLGLFPTNLSGMLIPRHWCEIAQKIKIDHQGPWGWVMTADVSEGVHRDSSTYTVWKVSGYEKERRAEPVKSEEFRDLDPKRFGQHIYNVSLDYPYCTIGIDYDGVGMTTALEVEELGGNVHRIRWGRPPHSDEDKKRYQDLRAYACVQAREAIFEERMKLIPGKKIVDQASNIPYDLGRGRYAIMQKQIMRSKGIKSPDLFDTHAFVFLVDYVPVSEDEGTEADEDEMVKWAREVIEGGDGNDE
jgi:hypothetical protein